MAGHEHSHRLQLSFAALAAFVELVFRMRDRRY